jgi:hypothetical protein
MKKFKTVTKATKKNIQILLAVSQELRNRRICFLLVNMKKFTMRPEHRTGFGCSATFREKKNSGIFSM